MKFQLKLLIYSFALFFPFAAMSAGIDQIRYDARPVITAGDMSAASINSLGFSLDQYTSFSCQAVWTGSPVGTLKIQVSGDIVADCTLPTNWVDYTNSSYAVSAAGNLLWNSGQANYRCVRVVYTKTSGTGTINALCGRKD